jgi:hypothetical protein
MCPVCKARLFNDNLTQVLAFSSLDLGLRFRDATFTRGGKNLDNWWPRLAAAEVKMALQAAELLIRKCNTDAVAEESSGHATRVATVASQGGKNWYYAQDLHRALRQVVLASEVDMASTSRFGSLALARKFESLSSSSLCTGFFRLDNDAGPFLLVRTDGMVDEMAAAQLRIAISFFHLPMSGLVAIHVASKPLRDKTTAGFLEQVYGLDYEPTREILSDAISKDELSVVLAGEGGMRIVIAETGQTMVGPRCEYDIQIPIDDNCRRVLSQEWGAVLAYHHRIVNPDFQRAGHRLYELMPDDADPILSG